MFRSPAAILSLLGSLLSSACGGSTPARTPTSVAPGDDMHDYDPCGGGDAAAVSCSDWASWTRINADTFRSKGHRDAWVDVHVDPPFADAYRAGVGPMPVGMRIVKAAHADVDGAPGQVTGLTVMGKMEPGYDPEHGDWFYGIYDPTGTVAKQQGKLEMCIDCHDQWQEHDYLGGVPELWK